MQLHKVISAAFQSLRAGNRGIIRPRTYASYAEYVAHQAAKLPTLDLSAYDEKFQRELAARLRNIPIVRSGASVLCLGARSGAECKAFISLGCFVAGIDLNPGPGNRHVMVGDFHDLQFADESVDIVYTNALDHALVLDRVLSEVHRVLRRNGHFVAEIVDPTVRGPGEYESLWWNDLHDVERVIQKQTFSVLQSTPFTYPWQGMQMVFVK